MTVVAKPYTVERGAYGDELLAGLFRCDQCNWPSVGMVRSDGGWVYVPDDAAAESTSDGGRVAWLPATAVGREFDDVPEHVAQAATEATAAASVNLYRASALMARAVLEATCKDKGITSGTLAAKIDRLHDEGHIRKHTRDVAHEIRYVGNDMAHGDFVQEVSGEDAEEVIDLMAEVLAEVYQGPARLSRHQARRAERRSPQ